MNRQSLRRLSLLVVVSFCALIALACSGDDDDKDKAKAVNTPEFVEDRRSAPSPGTLPPPVIVSSGPGATSLTIGPLLPPNVVSSSVSATSARNGGLTVRHTETATVPADQAFAIVQLQSISSGPGPFGAGVTAR